jgi:hypothetical protein
MRRITPAAANFKKCRGFINASRFYYPSGAAFFKALAAIPAACS